MFSCLVGALTFSSHIAFGLWEEALIHGITTALAVFAVMVGGNAATDLMVDSAGRHLLVDRDLPPQPSDRGAAKSGADQIPEPVAVPKAGEYVDTQRMVAVP